MSTEQMRSEFEEWYKSKYCFQGYEFDRSKNGSYQWIEHMWQSWQASRAALVVDLPNLLQPGADGPDDWYLHSDPDGEYMKADDVVSAIRDAGITVKEG